MTESGLRPETEATLLLCGSLAPTRRDEPAEPLHVGEFNVVLELLEQHSHSLPDVLEPVVVETLLVDPELPGKIAGRLETLLQRRTALLMAAERWSSLGFWVLDRTDPTYPDRFHQHLANSAPPLLYGAGESELLNRDQLRVAVVGSRDIDSDGEEFARSIGESAPEIEAITVSGGARGADRTAIDAALAAGGLAIAVLPGAMEQVATSRAYRDTIAEGRLLVVSPYHPRAKFTAGNAMGRNRLIYCLADVGIVVESAEGTGGTWSGATETLKNRWVPVGVRKSEPMPQGNAALIERDGIPISSEAVANQQRFSEWIEAVVNAHVSAPVTPEKRQLGLFGS